MIFVVERVTQIGIEGMDVVEAGEIRQNLRKTFRDGLLGEFDLSHAIEATNTVSIQVPLSKKIQNNHKEKLKLTRKLEYG